MESADYSPASEKVELSFSPIEKLPDSLLAKIFSYLPFKLRYQLCLVSNKWAAASRIPWTEVTFLNLNLIPRAMANPVLGLCPKVEIIEATDLIILLEKKEGLSIHENVHTMKLHNTKLALTVLACGGAEPSSDEVHSSFHDHFERFPMLAELILDNVTFALPRTEDGATSEPSFRDVGLRGWLFLPDQTVASLRRVVIADSDISSAGYYITMDLRGMQNLECVYLRGLSWFSIYMGGCSGLPQLRELCLINYDARLSDLLEKIVGNKFPKLEVLICSSDRSLDTAGLSQLLTMKMTLRVLVIAGRDEVLDIIRRKLDLEQELGVVVPLNGLPSLQLPVTLPAPERTFLPEANPPNQSRLPPLQIFVGGDFTKHVRFTLPPMDVAKFWRIDRPMPEYLAKPEVAEIFKDIFVAKLIREGPVWGQPDHPERFFSTEELLFR